MLEIEIYRGCAWYAEQPTFKEVVRWCRCRCRKMGRKFYWQDIYILLHPPVECDFYTEQCVYENQK